MFRIIPLCVLSTIAVANDICKGDLHILSCVTEDVRNSELLESSDHERYCKSMSAFYECVLEHLNKCKAENYKWAEGKLTLKKIQEEYDDLKNRCRLSETNAADSDICKNDNHIMTCVTEDVRNMDSLMFSDMERYCKAMLAFYECVLEHLEKCKAENYKWGAGTLTLEKTRKEYAAVKSRCFLLDKKSAEDIAKKNFPCIKVDFADFLSPKNQEEFDKYCKEVGDFYRCVLDHIKKCPDPEHCDFHGEILSLKEMQKDYANLNLKCSEKFHSDSEFTSEDTSTKVTSDGTRRKVFPGSTNTEDSKSSESVSKGKYPCIKGDLVEFYSPKNEEEFKNFCNQLSEVYNCLFDYTKKCPDPEHCEWNDGVLSLTKMRTEYIMLNVKCSEKFPFDHEFASKDTSTTVASDDSRTKVTSDDTSTEDSNKNEYFCLNSDLVELLLPETYEDFERFCKDMPAFYDCFLDYLSKCPDPERCMLDNKKFSLTKTRKEYGAMKLMCSVKLPLYTVAVVSANDMCDGHDVLSCVSSDVRHQGILLRSGNLERYCKSMSTFYECVLEHLERCQGVQDYSWGDGLLTLENTRSEYAGLKAVCSFSHKNFLTTMGATEVCNGKNVFSCLTPDIRDATIPTTRKGLKRFCKSMPRFYRCVINHLVRCQDIQDYEWARGTLTLENARKEYEMVKLLCSENYPAETVLKLDPDTLRKSFYSVEVNVKENNSLEI